MCIYIYICTYMYICVYIYMYISLRTHKSYFPVCPCQYIFQMGYLPYIQVEDSIWWFARLNSSVCFRSLVIWLVVWTHLKNMSSSIGMIIPNKWKHKKCSKPASSDCFCQQIILYVSIVWPANGYYSTMGYQMSMYQSK